MMDATSLKRLRLVFDGPAEDARFVEAEIDGKSVRIGEWTEREDGLQQLDLQHISTAIRCQYCGFTAGEAEKEFEAVEDARGVLDQVCGILFGDPDTTYDSLDDPFYDLCTEVRALVATKKKFATTHI